MLDMHFTAKQQQRRADVLKERPMEAAAAVGPSRRRSRAEVSCHAGPRLSGGAVIYPANTKRRSEMEIEDKTTSQYIMIAVQRT
jgi:hypothetical protein